MKQIKQSYKEGSPEARLNGAAPGEGNVSLSSEKLVGPWKTDSTSSSYYRIILGFPSLSSHLWALRPW